MRQILLIIGINLIGLSCVPISVSNSNIPEIPGDNTDFSPNIGLVRLIPSPLTPNLNDPIIPLGKTLELQFDLLSEEFEYLNAKISRYDSRWQKSLLNDLEFLEVVNDFPLNQYEFSQSNFQPYISFKLILPRITKSGNYVITVFDESSNPLFSRRFVIYEQLVSIENEIQRSTIVQRRNLDHQINFTINYGSLEVTRPELDIKPVILQNFNWNIAIDSLSPTDARLERQTLNYKHFNGENSIPAFNEFRFFDTRTLANRGQNVIQIGKSTRGVEVLLEEQKSRGSEVYSEEFKTDLNGNFITRNLDQNETDIQSEYSWVNFKIPSSINVGEVFVAGKYNSWILNNSNKLEFDLTAGNYEGAVLMKQGFYNYLFWIKSDSNPIHQLEGSHFQTTNDYQIIIYYREPGTLFDRVVGFNQFG